MACDFLETPLGGTPKTPKTPGTRNQGDLMTTTDQWDAFEREVMEMAGAIRQAQTVKYADALPADVARDLDVIDKALTTALQVLGRLDMEHESSQDLISRPYNHPVVMALWHGQAVDRSIHGKPIDFARPGSDRYPTDVIDAMRGMRDAARRAADMTRPKRGNSSDRQESSRRASWVGRNFVRLHWQTFGEWPPISKTGRVVDLLGKALETAGAPDSEPDGVLRRAVNAMRAAGAFGWAPQMVNQRGI